jgi:predicted thioesterase
VIGPGFSDIHWKARLAPDMVCNDVGTAQVQRRKMELQIGLTGEKEMIVTQKDLASFTGNIGADVLSTHCVVLLMELAAREAIDGRLAAGQLTLGTRVAVRHLSAAPIGSRVRAVARLIAVEGRKLYFHVAAYDEVEKLAEGENEQVIVSQDFFLKKVKSKDLKGAGT